MDGKDILSNPKQLIPFLNKKLYKQGDCHSPGTGFCIKKDYKVYLSPAGSSVDLLESDDIFVFNEMLDNNGNPDILQAPSDENLKASTYSKLYLHLLEEFSCESLLIAQSQDSILIGDLYSEKVVFSHRAWLENFKIGVGCKETLKPTDNLQIPILQYKSNQDELISDIINALYSNMPTCACIVKGFGLIVLGDSWINVRNMFQVLKELFSIDLRYQQFRIRSNINNGVSALNEQVTDLATDFKVKKEREENLVNLDDEEVFREYMISPDRVSQSIKPLKAEKDIEKDPEKKTQKRKSSKIDQEKETHAKRVKEGNSNNEVNSTKTVSIVDESVDEDGAEIELTLSVTEREEFSDDLEDLIENKDDEKEDLSKNSSNLDKNQDTSKGNKDENNKTATTTTDVDDCTNVQTLETKVKRKEAIIRQKILIDTIEGKFINIGWKESSFVMLKWLETCLDAIQLNGKFLKVNIQNAKAKLRKLFGCLACSRCIASISYSKGEVNATSSTHNSSSASTNSTIRAFDLRSKLTSNADVSQNLVPNMPPDVGTINGNNKQFTGTVQKTSITLLDGSYSKTNIQTFSSQSQPMMFDNSAGHYQIAAQTTQFHQGFDNFSMNNAAGNINEGFNPSTLMCNEPSMPRYQTFEPATSSYKAFEPAPPSYPTLQPPQPSYPTPQPPPPSYPTPQPPPPSYPHPELSQASFQPNDPPPPGSHHSWLLADNPDDPKVLENALKREQYNLVIKQTARTAVLAYMDGEPFPCSGIKGSNNSRNIYEQIELYLETMACSPEFKESAIAYFKDAYLDPNYVQPQNQNIPLAKKAVQAYIDGEPGHCPGIKGSKKCRSIFRQIELYLETMNCSAEFKERATAYFKDAYLDPNYVQPPNEYTLKAKTAVQAYIDGEPFHCPVIKGSTKCRSIFRQIELYLETMNCSAEFKERATAYFKDAYLDPNYVQPPNKYTPIAKTAVQAYIDGEPFHCPVIKGSKKCRSFFRQIELYLESMNCSAEFKERAKAYFKERAKAYFKDAYFVPENRPPIVRLGSGYQNVEERERRLAPPRKIFSASRQSKKQDGNYKPRLKKKTQTKNQLLTKEEKRLTHLENWKNGKAGKSRRDDKSEAGPSDDAGQSNAWMLDY